MFAALRFRQQQLRPRSLFGYASKFGPGAPSPWRICLDEVPITLSEEDILAAWSRTTVLVGVPGWVEKIRQDHPLASYFIHLNTQGEYEANLKAVRFGLLVKGHRCELSDSAVRTALEVRFRKKSMTERSIRVSIGKATSISPIEVFLTTVGADVMFGSHHYAYTAFHILSRPMRMDGSRVNVYWRPRSALTSSPPLLLSSFTPAYCSNAI